MEFGVQVQRQVEASYLKLPYTMEIESTPGRVVIEAGWQPYTRRELWEIDAQIAEAEGL